MDGKVAKMAPGHGSTGTGYTLHDVPRPSWPLLFKPQQ
jgi:hypothetical protein